MLMSQIYVPFVPNVRDQGKRNVLNRRCAFNRKKNPTHERPCICNSIGQTTRCCRFDYWLMIWNLTVPITKTRKLFRSAGTKPQKVNNLTIIQFNFRVHDSSLSVLKMALTCCNSVKLGSHPLLFFVIKECRGIVQ